MTILVKVSDALVLITAKFCSVRRSHHVPIYLINYLNDIEITDHHAYRPYSPIVSNYGATNCASSCESRYTLLGYVDLLKEFKSLLYFSLQKFSYS